MTLADREPLRPNSGSTPRLQFMRVFIALILREMTTRYSRASGGFLWAIVGPLASITVMSVVWSMMFRSPSLGSSFIMFISSGSVPFQIYGDVQNTVSGAVRYNRSLMQYPAVTPMDAILARATLSFLTYSLIGTAILTGAVLVSDTPVNLDLLVMSKAMLTAAALGLGIGSVNSVIVAFFPTWGMLWKVLTAPLYILSAVLYLFEEAPRAFQRILWYNPILHVTAYMRSGIYGAYKPEFVSLAYVWTIALTTIVIGLYFSRRHRSMLINPRF
jgi:capsular polysaccharide transport system permease protein